MYMAFEVWKWSTRYLKQARGITKMQAIQSAGLVYRGWCNVLGVTGLVQFKAQFMKPARTSLRKGSGYIVVVVM